MRPKVIAHRGASYLAPENTLAAFRLAASLGADGIEFDTLLTADRQLVVHHEYITDLHCSAHKAIPNCTLAELKELDFGSWKGEQWAGEKIPTFAEAVEACSSVETIQVEFKSPLGANSTTDQDAFAELILEEVESSGLADKIVVTSFNHGILSRVKRLSPNQRVGVLTLNSVDSYFAPPPALLQALGLDFGWGLGGENGLPDEEEATRTLLELSQQGLLDDENVNPARWTMDRIWAITSDYPGQNLFELLQSLLSQHNLVSYVSSLDFKPEVLSCQYNTCFRDRDLVQQIQAMGIEAAPWPVDAIYDLKSILDMDPAAIVTNRPERLLEMLDPAYTIPPEAAAMLG